MRTASMLTASMLTASILSVLFLISLPKTPVPAHQPTASVETFGGEGAPEVASRHLSETAFRDTSDWVGTWKMVEATDLVVDSTSLKDPADRIEEFFVFTEERVESISSVGTGSTCMGADMEILGVEEGVITVLNEANSQMGYRVQSISQDTMVVVEGGTGGITGSDPEGIRKVLARSEAEPQEALGCEKVEEL